MVISHMYTIVDQPLFKSFICAETPSNVRGHVRVTTEVTEVTDVVPMVTQIPSEETILRRRTQLVERNVVTALFWVGV
jgi:hypothetical protein